MHHNHRTVRPSASLRPGLIAVLSALSLAACSGSDPIAAGPGEDDAGPVLCTLDQAFFFQTAVAKDGIPALSEPQWVGADHPTDLWFLSDDSRVVGMVVEGAPYAVPQNLLWYHEIANVTVHGTKGALDLAITYCPLTGSSMVFDRSAVDGAEFGVSGLLYKSNLIMYDRRTPESLWPQMSASAECGPALGTTLPLVPSIEMTWDGWRTLHPDTRVLGSPGGDMGPYDGYPYGDYEDFRTGFIFPMPTLDTRRAVKERVLGLIQADGGTTAFPFEVLRTLAPFDAVEWQVGQTPAVILWDRGRESAMAYLAVVDGAPLSFVGGTEGITDSDTGSQWSVGGLAVAGPLAGTRLEPVRDAFVAFWGAWYAFHPDTELWGPAKPSVPLSQTARTTGSARAVVGEGSG